MPSHILVTQNRTRVKRARLRRTKVVKRPSGGRRKRCGTVRPILKTGHYRRNRRWAFFRAGETIARERDQSLIFRGRIECANRLEIEAGFIGVGRHLEFLTTQLSDAFKQRCAEGIRGFVERC